MIKRIFTAILALILFAGNVFAANPKREMRSSWLTTVWGLDWPSTQGSSASTQKNQMISYLDNLEALNMTGTCFQVRSMGDAMYPSQYAPWSSYITGTRGKDPGWDPLAFFVEEAHKRGLEAYVWLNPYRWSSGTVWSTDMDKEWQNNNMLIAGTANPDYVTFNPALPETRQLIVNVIKEILNNYNIDGILFDDYFYPSGGTAETSSAPDYSHYKASGTTMSIGDWRRRNVNDMVADCYNAIKELRPDVRFGIAPAGVSSKSASKYGLSLPSSYGVSAGDWQYAQIYSDPLAWMYEKTIDFISPQIYWLTTDDSAPFGPLTQWWSYAAKELGVHYYASHSVSYIASADNQSSWTELAKQVSFNRQYVENNACGSVYYSTKNLTSGTREHLKSDVYSTKSLTPHLSHKSGASYGKVANLTYSNGTLTWEAVKNGNSIIRYTVYAVPMDVTFDNAQAADGDGIDVQYLQKVEYGTSYTVASDKQANYYYVVCVFDGYGKEHEPAVVNYPEAEISKPKKDKNSYENVGSLSVESVWMRSILSDYNNIAFESNGGLNRGMCVKGDYVYVSGRSKNSSDATCYLRKYDINTGEHIGDIILGDEVKMGYYPCNDVIKDTKGNICINNLILADSKIPLTIFMVNTETAAVTKVAEISTNYRLDHVALWGDVTTGNFMVYAAIRESKNIMRWVYENGQQTKEETTTVKELYSGSGMGTAPRVTMIDENSMFVDGGNQPVTRFNFATGEMEGSFKDNPTLMPSGVEGNGCTFFTLNGKKYVVYSNSDDQIVNNASTGLTPWTFNVVSTDDNMSFSSMQLLWTLPKDGLGGVYSGTMQAPVDYAVMNDNTVRVVLYVPGCGLCAYDITDGLVTNIENVEDKNDIIIKAVGKTIKMSEAAQSVRVYNLMGMQVAQAANVAELNTDLSAGLYVVEAVVNGAVYTQKVIVK